MPIVNVTKTPQALDSENTDKATKGIDLGPLERTIFSQIFKLRKAANPSLTLADFRAELIADYKSFL